MMAVLFNSRGCSLLRRLLLVCILCPFHFQDSHCFSVDIFQRTINNSNINTRMHFLVHNRCFVGKRRQPRVASTGSSDDVLESEALSSMQRCYQSAAASAFIDGITVNWSSLRQGRNLETSLAADLLGTVWKVGLAASLYRVFTIYQKFINKKEEETFFQPLYYICRTMSRLWREATWVLAFGCLADLVGLFQDTSLWVGVFAILIAGGGCFRRVTDRETEVLATVDDLQSSAAAARRMGRVAARNMAYCTGALIVRASIIPLSAFYQTTWRGRIKQILGLPTPVVTGALLWQLRKSFQAALVGATSLGLQPEVKNELFTAQRSFYSKLASTFKSEAIFKLGFFLVQIVTTFMNARKI
jgi:hypothetical protein